MHTSDLGLTRASGEYQADGEAFITAVWEHYRRHGRDLPWRHTRDPYEILVSEVMLQQTQVARVLVKYEPFLRAFPGVASLAVAPVAEVLAAWSGLGYNRRALSLQRAARLIVDGHGGRIPASVAELRRLPGIGPATAAAVVVFAFGRPEPFIETNIRAACIHWFFPTAPTVSDSDILPLVEATMDRDRPREWFYALMDYGVWTKRTFQNPGRRSSHHAVQSPFPGSRRQQRAGALQALLSVAPASRKVEEIRALLPDFDGGHEELASVLDELLREGFLTEEDGGYRIA